GGTPGHRRARRPASRLVCRVERAVRERAPGTRALAGRDPSRPDRDLRPALPDVSLAPGRRPGPARRAVWARRRYLPALRASLQLLRRRLDRIHRALRHGRANGGGDGHLSRRGRRSEARGPGWTTDPRVADG